MSFCELRQYIFSEFQSIAVYTYLQISPISYGDYVYPSLAGPLGLFVVAAAVLG